MRRVTLGVAAVGLFGLPLFLWPGITDSSYGKSIAALVFVAVLTLVWSLRVWREGGHTLRLPWVALPFVAFALTAGLSLVHAMSARVVLQSLVLVLAYGQVAWFVADNVRTRGEVRLLLLSILASGFAASTYGILQYAGVLSGATQAAGLNNVISFMGNRNFLGGYLAYILFPSVLLAVRLRSKLVRLATILMLATVLATTILVQQTAVVIILSVTAFGLAAGWIVYRLWKRPRRLPRLIGLTLVLVAVSVTAVVLIDRSSAATSESPSRVTLSLHDLWIRNSGDTRLWNWLVALQMLEVHPWTGVGLGNYKLNYVTYSAALASTPRGEALALSAPTVRAAQAHNEYVQVAAELGVLGLLALFGLLATLAVSLWRRIRRAQGVGDRTDLILLYCGLMTFFAHALVSFPAHLPSSALAVMAVLGLCLSRAYGDQATLALRLRRPMVRSLLIVGSCAALSVAVIAVRDARADVLIGRGIAESRSGDPAAAETLFERSLRLDFCPRQTYYYLANVEGVQGKIDEALEHLELCLTRFTDQRVYLEYADVVGSLGRISEARAAALLVVSSHPPIRTEMDARLLLAVLDLLEGDSDIAAEGLRTMIASHPEYAASYVHLGDLYLSLGRIEDARSTYEAGLDAIKWYAATLEGRLASPETKTAVVLAQTRSTLDELRTQRTILMKRLADLP